MADTKDIPPHPRRRASNRPKPRSSPGLKGERARDSHRLRHLEGLLDLDRAAFQDAGLSARLDNLLVKALEILGVSSGAIRLMNGTGLFTLTAHRGLPASYLEEMEVVSLKQDPFSLLLSRGPQLFPDIVRDSRFGNSPFQKAGVQSLLLVPIRYDGRMVGTFSLATFHGERTLTTEDLRFMNEAGARVALAILDSERYEEAQNRIAELSALQKISTAIGFTLSEKRAAELIVETVEELLKTHHVSLLTRVSGTEVFNRLAVWGKVTLSGIPDEGFIASTDALGVVAWVARNGQPQVVNDVRQEPRYKNVFPGVLSEIVVPILSQGAVIGVINVESERLGAFDQHTLRLLSIVASQAATALENSRLYAQARQKISDLTALYEIGLEITSTLGVDQVLARIVEIVVARLKPHSCGFYQLTEEEPRELVRGPFFRGETDHTAPAGSDGLRIPLDGTGVIAWVAREGRAAFLPDVREDRRYLTGYKEVTSEIAVPLLAKGKVIGILNVESDRPGAFTEATLEFLNTIAQQASVAIQNARLYEMLEQSYFDTVRTLILAMDAKDPYTRGHSERVRRYAVETARLMGMSEEDVRRVSYAGLLHDIGKIGVREGILSKPGELTPEEFEEVKLHSVLGQKLVHNVTLLKGVGVLIRSEHENFSGGGYPDNLVGEAIPLGSRIIAVADAYDAMTTDRAYHHEMTTEASLGELRKCAGKQFDPRVVEALGRIVSEEKPEGS